MKTIGLIVILFIESSTHESLYEKIDISRYYYWTLIWSQPFKYKGCLKSPDMFEEAAICQFVKN